MSRHFVGLRVLGERKIKGGLDGRLGGEEEKERATTGEVLEAERKTRGKQKKRRRTVGKENRARKRKQKRGGFRLRKRGQNEKEKTEEVRAEEKKTEGENKGCDG